MSLSFWKKLGRLASSGFAALLMVAGTADAADPTTEDLKAQLDRQQKQIEYLQRVIEQGGVRPISEGNTERVAIERIVEDYLKQADKDKPKDGKPADKVEWMEVGRDTAFNATFSNGLHFATRDGAFRAALRGRWNMDWGFADQDDNINLYNGNNSLPNGTRWDDGVLFRRARLGIQGTIWEVFDFVAEFDFAESWPTSSSIGWREVWVGVNQLPYIGTFRVGHIKEPFGLEHLTSSRYLTFIERSVLDAAFIGDDYNPLMIITNTAFDDRVQWALALSRTADNAGSNDLGDGRYNIIGRVTALPVYANDGRCLVHVGASARWGELSSTPSSTTGNPGAQTVNLRARPYRVDPMALVQTGTIAADHWNHYGLEFLAIMGPFSIQAEAMRVEFENAVNVGTGAPIGNPEFFAFYIFGTYSLTGEHRQYNRRAGVIDRPIVYEPFFLVNTGEDGCEGCCWGKGAWEIAFRYGYLDLLDDGLSGTGAPTTGAATAANGAGYVHQYTFGLNWYWNRNMKVQFNYEWLHVKHTVPANSGDAHTFVTRFAWDF